MAGDPYWGETSLLLHMDDAALTDVKAHTVLKTGGVTYSPAASVFGGYSAYFDGVDDKLQLSSVAAWNLGATYTIEFWMYPLAMPPVDNQCRVVVISSNNSTYSLALSIANDGSGVLSVLLAAAVGLTIPAGVFTADAFHHYALVVNGGTGSAFKDGVLVAGPTPAITVQTVSSSGALVFGFDTTTGWSSKFNGYLDEVRITKGVARYLSNFPVATAAHPGVVAKLSGTTRDAAGNIAQKLVRAYRQDTGAMVSQAVSDAGTGAFTLDAGGGVPYYLTEHDTSSLTASGGTAANAAILDNLTPL